MKKKLMRPASCFIVGLTWIACSVTLVGGTLVGDNKVGGTLVGESLVGGTLQASPGGCWENNQVVMNYIATKIINRS